MQLVFKWCRMVWPGDLCQLQYRAVLQFQLQYRAVLQFQLQYRAVLQFQLQSLCLVLINQPHPKWGCQHDLYNSIATHYHTPDESVLANSLIDHFSAPPAKSDSASTIDSLGTNWAWCLLVGPII